MDDPVEFIFPWQQTLVDLMLANPEMRLLVHMPRQYAHAVSPEMAELIQAAFAWRSELIPNTSTTTINAVNRLSRALDALTEPQEQS